MRGSTSVNTPLLVGGLTNLVEPDEEATNMINAGPDNATGFAVTARLPAGLIWVRSSTSQGTDDNGTGLWNIDSLPPELGATMEIVARVDRLGNFTNVAHVNELTLATEGVPDPVLPGNSLTYPLMVTTSPWSSSFDPRHMPSLRDWSQHVMRCLDEARVEATAFPLAIPARFPVRRAGSESGSSCRVRLGWPRRTPSVWRASAHRPG
jgi:hypothetical protein